MVTGVRHSWPKPCALVFMLSWSVSVPDPLDSCGLETELALKPAVCVETFLRMWGLRKPKLETTHLVLPVIWGPRLPVLPGNLLPYHVCCESNHLLSFLVLSMWQAFSLVYSSRCALANSMMVHSWSPDTTGLRLAQLLMITHSSLFTLPPRSHVAPLSLLSSSSSHHSFSALEA